MATGDVVSTGAMITGAGSLGKAGVKAVDKSLSKSVDEALDVKVNALDGSETSLEEVRLSTSTAKSSYQTTVPKSLEEQLTIKEVKANPEIGKKIGYGIAYNGR